MKKIICICCFIAVAFVSFAQDQTVAELKSAGTKKVLSLDSNGWKKGGTFILNLNQGALSNWAAGGENYTLGFNGLFNYSMNLRSGRNTWDNLFDVALGFQNAASYEKFRKIDDRIDITSKYGRQISKFWYGSLLFNFNSQFMPGYDYSVTPFKKISNFLTPGKIILAPGFNYKTANRFSFFISPTSFRWVLKKDQDFYNISAFGVDSARKSNMEFGAYLTATYKAEFTKWATYTGRFDLFSNYRRNPQNVDLLMNNLLILKFNKFLATNISLDLIYDDDVLTRLQVKEILGIGLTLKL
jgi:hypothetical protein